MLPRVRSASSASCFAACVTLGHHGANLSAHGIAYRLRSGRAGRLLHVQLAGLDGLFRGGVGVVVHLLCHFTQDTAQLVGSGQHGAGLHFELLRRLVGRVWECPL